MDLGLQEQVAVVVGGANGIGRGISEAFAAEGAHVAVLDVAESTSETAAQAAKAHGVRTLGTHCDIANFESVERSRDAVFGEFQTYDHVVVVAAIGSGKFGFPFLNLQPCCLPRHLGLFRTSSRHFGHEVAAGVSARLVSDVTWTTVRWCAHSSENSAQQVTDASSWQTWQLCSQFTVSRDFRATVFAASRGPGMIALLVCQPDIVSSSRHSDQRQHGPQRKMSSGSLDCQKPSLLVAAFNDSKSVKREFRHLECDSDELQETKKSGDSPTQKEDFLLELNRVSVENVERYDFGG